MQEASFELTNVLRQQAVICDLHISASLLMQQCPVKVQVGWRDFEGRLRQAAGYGEAEGHLLTMDVNLNAPAHHEIFRLYHNASQARAVA